MALPDAGTPTPPSAPTRQGKGRRGRPAFGVLVLAAVGFRGLREVLELAAGSTWGAVGALGVAAAGVAFVLLWRAHQRRQVRARGGIEHTPEAVRRQLADSELLPPAFEEDGTILGASVLALNQMPKVLEVNTAYEVFGSDGERLGSLEQFGQSRGKQVARVLTAFDQLFTHHFELRDREGSPVLRLTRPRKLFRTRLRVFDGADHYLGTIQQENIFWKIRFAMLDPTGAVVGRTRAANLRAWDFHVVDAGGQEVAELVKSWEGWGRTAFTRADRWVLRVQRPLPDPLRSLVVAAPLAVDLALKQDARGLA